MIVLIPTEFLPCALVSNCYLVKIFFIPIIREKFEFTSHAHSWSFANIIILCRLGSVHVVFLSYYYRERTKLKWKIYMIRALPNRNWREFQTFNISPRSGTDSAQWDWGIRHSQYLIVLCSSAPRLCPSWMSCHLMNRKSWAISRGYKWEMFATFIWLLNYFLHALIYYY